MSDTPNPDPRSMTSEQRIEELRNAVVDAALKYEACSGTCDCLEDDGPYCSDALSRVARELRIALRPDPLRDAVELLRRVYDTVAIHGAPMRLAEMDAFLAAYDRDGRCAGNPALQCDCDADSPCQWQGDQWDGAA